MIGDKCQRLGVDGIDGIDGLGIDGTDGIDDPACDFSLSARSLNSLSSRFRYHARSSAVIAACSKIDKLP